MHPLPIRLQAAWLRGGSSKGLFMSEQYLLQQCHQCHTTKNAAILKMIGSPDRFGSQMNGIGGGTSSTSKVALVDPSSRPDCDVEYLFGAVSIKEPLVDYSGSCGNLTAAVGVYALLQGWTKATPHSIHTVSIWQRNLKQKILVHVPCDYQGMPQQNGSFSMDGVSGTGSPIHCEFLRPGFTNESLVLPTGNKVDTLLLHGKSIQATLVKAGNPTIFIKANDFHSLIPCPQPLDTCLSLDEPSILQALESLRQAGGIAMGMNQVDQQPATPKIVLVGPSQDHQVAGGAHLLAKNIDLQARILSMGRLHHTFTATGAIALAAAAAIPDTIVSQVMAKKNIMGNITFGHRAGTMTLQAKVELEPRPVIHSVSFIRSARLLMEGYVYLGE